MIAGVAGVISTVLGLGLTVLATTRLVRSMPGWWRLAAVPIGLVTLVTIVLPSALAVFVSNPPHFALGDATPADHGMAYEDVTVTTDDGVDLEAWYMPSETERRSFSSAAAAAPATACSTWRHCSPTTTTGC